ncbi:hypothetical protein H312_01037 [Anncaliia algerae PRA339]|uniref:Transposase IS30-like HTH domain-containing protein n=1 Tax=Anncaliia algerae PRA339 TaxID=1288291 RepID=A0A059F3D3_9MICR|nr:hypothetical protein H312_01037 [Anncaliia algerae PRA339]
MSIERKPRQTVTEEKYEIIKRFHQAGRKISEVANFLNFSMKTISRLYKKIENNISFVSRNGKVPVYARFIFGGFET